MSDCVSKKHFRAVRHCPENLWHHRHGEEAALFDAAWSRRFANARDEVDGPMDLIAELLQQFSRLVPVAVCCGGFQLRANLRQGDDGQDAGRPAERVGFGDDRRLILFRESGVEFLQSSWTGLREIVQQREREVQVVQALVEKSTAINGRFKSHVMLLLREELVAVARREMSEVRFGPSPRDLTLQRTL